VIGMAKGVLPWYRQWKGYSGFTLVEVLVALVILLAALTITASSYNASLDFVSRAEIVAGISRQVIDIRQRVRTLLETGATEGQASAGDLSYAWQAVPEASSVNFTGGYDEITGAPEYGNFQLTLYQVELIISSSQTGRDSQSRYQYRELIWQKVMNEEEPASDFTNPASQPGQRKIKK